jgi:hypothetical protein
MVKMKKFVTSSKDCLQEMQIKFEEEEEVNLNIWKNIKRQFQQHFPAKHKPTMVKENPKVDLKKKTKANQIPRVS